jgi:hypothetical protein
MWAVAIAEKDSVVVPSFEPLLPIGCSPPVFSAFFFCGNVSEIFPAEIQMEDS